MKSLYHFGPFALDPNKRALFRQGKPVTLTPKAFDVLLYLAQNPNRVVSKEELLKSVWAGSFVEEGNLTQNVFLLRKVLSEESGESGLIVTVPRVGYQFAAEVATIAETVPVPVGTSGKMLLQGVEATTPGTPALQVALVCACSHSLGHRRCSALSTHRPLAHCDPNPTDHAPRHGGS